MHCSLFDTPHCRAQGRPAQGALTTDWALLHTHRRTSDEAHNLSGSASPTAPLTRRAVVNCSELRKAQAL